MLDIHSYQYKFLYVMLLLTSGLLLLPMQMSLLDSFQDFVRAICSVEIPGNFEGM
jgi:hypothetical protein